VIDFEDDPEDRDRWAVSTIRADYDALVNALADAIGFDTIGVEDTIGEMEDAGLVVVELDPAMPSGSAVIVGPMAPAELALAALETPHARAEVGR
jgi:predicted transcriptional regulator